MLVDWIDKMFIHAFEKQWYTTYWAFDIHGVILKPNYRKNSQYVNFYPYAKETLQLLTKREDIIMIMYTSSYPKEIEYYYRIFKNNKIYFKYINENPDIDSIKGNFGYYKNKFYFNVLFEDKSGFSAEIEWKQIYDYLIDCEKRSFLPNPKWSTKY